MELSTEQVAAVVGALVLLLSNTAALVKVWTDNAKTKEDRAATRAARDQDSQQLHDDMIRAQERISTQTSQIKTLFEMAAASNEAVNTLKTQNTRIITLMDTIVKAIDELKNEVKRSQQR